MKMKDFPKGFEINGHWWTLKFVRRIKDHGPEVLGLCDFAEKTLYCKLGQTPKERLSTVVHEAMHAVEEEFNVKIGHDLIYKLEGAVADFLLANLWSQK
jgi:hypothetical protein